MIILKLVLLLVLIFIVYMIIKFGVAYMKSIDYEHSIKERMNDIDTVDKYAHQISDFEKHNNEKIENERKNVERINNFLN